jgi:hypothetical protein
MRNSIFALVATSAMMGCSPSAKLPPPPPPPPSGPPSPPAAGHVEMTLTCFSDGTLGVTLAPWVVTLPDPNAAFTLVNSHSSSVPAIVAGKPGSDPFGGNKFPVPNNGNLVLARPAAGTAPGTYHYSVTATCPSANGPQTTIIDPDMIIPPPKKK